MSELGQDLIEALEEANQHRQGQKPDVRVSTFPEFELDVQTLRQNLGMSQTEFAAQFSISLPTLKNWEQGRREPHGPAKTLLRIIASEPEAALRALSHPSA